MYDVLFYFFLKRSDACLFQVASFQRFLGVSLSVSSIVQHKKKDKTIYTKGLHGSSVMFHSGVIYLSCVSTSASVAQ